MSEAGPKVAQGATGTNEFPTFDANPLADQFRNFAERTVEQSRETYERLKTGAETTRKAMEASFESARTLSGDLSLKSLAAMRASTELGFSHLESLFGARSVSEILELQGDYARRHLELAVNQAKDFQDASSRGAADIARPVKEVVEKAWGDLKVS